MKHRLFWEDWLSGWSGIILKSHSPYIVKSKSKVHFSSFSFVTFTFTFSFVILINISINRGLYRTWRNQKKPTSMKYNPMWGIWHFLLLFRHINAMKMEETAERPSSCLMITATIQIHFHTNLNYFPWNKSSCLQFENMFTCQPQIFSFALREHIFEPSTNNPNNWEKRKKYLRMKFSCQAFLVLVQCFKEYWNYWDHVLFEEYFCHILNSIAVMFHRVLMS